MDRTEILTKAMWNIDESLIQECLDADEETDKVSSAPKARKRPAKKRLLWAAGIAAAVLLSGITTYAVTDLYRKYSGGNSVPAVADKETVTIKSLSLVPMTYEEVLKACNLLLVGTCEKVISSEPAEGYTAYSFTVNEVLGGNYEENEITFSIPIAKIGFYGMIGTDDYLIGHRYLLPILQSELVCETTYTTGAFGLTLDLTEEKYIFRGKTIDIPKKENVLSYSAHVFNSIERPEPIRKEYTNEFEEFYDESAFICKMKVVRKYEGIGRDILHCKCLETYKGNTADLYSFLEDGLISIAVRNGTAEEGSEYIIGFKGAGAYQISVRNAVQPVSEELLRKLKK